MSGCQCGKAAMNPSVYVHDGTCWWCGHGEATLPTGRRSTRRRLPRDLGDVSRRPDTSLENVVRLDELTVPRSFLPPVELEDEPVVCRTCLGHFEPGDARRYYCCEACRRVAYNESKRVTR